MRNKGAGGLFRGMHITWELDQSSALNIHELHRVRPAQVSVWGGVDAWECIFSMACLERVE